MTGSTTTTPCDDLSVLADAALVLREHVSSDAWLTTPGVLPDALCAALRALVAADEPSDFLDAAYALCSVDVELLVPGFLPAALRVALLDVVFA